MWSTVNYFWERKAKVWRKQFLTSSWLHSCQIDHMNITTTRLGYKTFGLWKWLSIWAFRSISVSQGFQVFNQRPNKRGESLSFEKKPQWTWWPGDDVELDLLQRMWRQRLKTRENAPCILTKKGMIGIMLHQSYDYVCWTGIGEW